MTDLRTRPDFRDDVPVAAAKSKGPIRRILAEAANWRELRGSPHGVAPALLIALVVLLQTVDSSLVVVAGPEIVRDLDTEINAVVGLGAIVTFCATFAGLGLAWYADRHVRVRLVGLATMFSGLLSMATSRAQNLATLGTLRVADDLASEASAVPRLSLLADYYPPELRGKVFALRSTAYLIALSLSAPVGGYFVVRVGWRPSFLAVGASLVVVGAFIALRLREPVRGYMERRAMGVDEEAASHEPEPFSFGESIRTVWAVRTLRRLFVADIFGLGGLYVIQSYLGFFAAEEYGLNAFERGLILIPATITTLFGGYVAGGLVDAFTRRDPSRVFVILGLLSLVGSLPAFVLGFAPPLPLLIAMVALNSFGAAVVGPAASVVTAQVIPPTVRTQAFQVLGLAILPALLIAVPGAQALFDAYGFFGPFLFGAPMLIISSLILLSAAPFFDLDMRSALAVATADDEWRRAKASGTARLLVCRGLDVAYDDVQVLFKVDFDVEEGEIIALLGTNGAGKSTLLRAISGTQQATSGAVVFDGRDITHMPPHEIAARNVVHMPGGRGTFPGLSVRENLVMGGWLSVDNAGDGAARLAEVFDIFPVLAERADALAGSLSGGEQQQLSLAQSCLANPKLLMIDELSLGLSPVVVEKLLDVVREIHRRGVTIIIVEQSVGVALQLAERAVFMEKGEVRFFGATRDLLARPDILRAVYVKGTASANGRSVAQTALSRTTKLASAPAVLSVDNLSKSYGGVQAVDAVSFELGAGVALGLIGPNGAGKTTLFDLISGYQTPDTGSVALAGVDVSAMPAEERAQRGLVRRFQDARLFPSLTVQETLLVALDQRHDARHALFNIAQTPGTRRAERRLRVRADQLVELLGLGDHRNKLIGELSTGLRRITDLACVLAADPEVLLLDEPSSGIAEAETAAMAPLLRRVQRETGASMLLIEHSMSLVSAVSDELLALDQGGVVTRGTPAAVLDDERVIAAFLGATTAVAPR